MHDPVRVRLGQALRHLDRQVDGARRAHPARHQHRQRLAPDQLHGDEGGAVRLVDLVDDADRGMGERGGGLRFAAQPALALGVVPRPRRQDLEGDLPSQAGVGGAVDDAHPTLADLARDPVPPESLHQCPITRF